MKHLSLGTIIGMILLGLILVRANAPQPIPHYTLEEWKQAQGQLESYLKPPYANANSPDDILNTLSYHGFSRRCQMTADQARQLANFVQALYPADVSQHPEFSFLIGDFEGNDIPHLRIREFHRRDIVGSPYDQTIIDRNLIIALSETPQVIFDTNDTPGTSELETRHSLGDFVLLIHHFHPTPSDWFGNYYKFTDGGLQLVYRFERAYDPDSKLWSLTDNDKTTVYTNQEYRKLTLEERNDPIYMELGMDHPDSPTALGGANLSIPQLVEALNMYADFLEEK